MINKNSNKNNDNEAEIIIVVMIIMIQVRPTSHSFPSFPPYNVIQRNESCYERKEKITRERPSKIQR